MELSVHPFYIARKHYALIAVKLRRLTYKLGIPDRAAVHADLVRAAFQHPVEIIDRVDTAAHSERDEYLRRHARQDIREYLPSFDARRDIVKHQLVRAALIVERRHLHRIRHSAHALEIDTLYYLAILDIQAGHYPLCYHCSSPLFSIASPRSSAPV